MPYKATPIELSYLAGIVDGEGHVCICASQRTAKRYKSKSYYLQLRVANTNLILMGFLEKFDGSINSYWDKNPKHKTLYNWGIGGIHAANLLKEIYPYLLLKKEQAKIALEFQDGFKYFRSFQKLPKEEIEKRENLVIKMKLLNLKGRGEPIITQAY